jgi:hypothetical protein
MGRACSNNGDKRNVYRLFLGWPEGKRLLGRPKCMWVNNIEMDLGETGLVWFRAGTGGELL